MEERSHYVKGHAIEMRMSIIWVCGRMELHLHGMERSYGFESRQYPLNLVYVAGRTSVRIRYEEFWLHRLLGC